MARYDDLDTKTIAIAAVLSSIVLVILLLAGRAMAYAWEYSYEEERAAKAKYLVSDDTIAAQKSQLTSYAEVQVEATEEGQQPTRRLVIPIEKAKELVRGELAPKPKT